MTVHYAVFAFSGDFSYSFLSHSSGERIHNIAKGRAEEFVEDVPVACSMAIVSFRADIKFIYKEKRRTANEKISLSVALC
jgi:hypothetical protein